MISVLIGNLFESKITTIVNTVNCVGVMGKGIASEFKKRFPEMFNDYVNLLKAAFICWPGRIYDRVKDWPGIRSH